MQKTLDLWEGGIRATGGALVPSKSHWYLVHFEWKNGQWSYGKSTSDELYVRNPEGARVALECLPSHEARRTLGFRLAPDGNNNAEKANMLKVAKEWAAKVNVLGSRSLAWVALSTTILPKLRYPLTVTTLTQKDCGNIMQPILHAALPAIGVNRNFPHALVHAPLRFQGLNIPDLWVEQGLDHLKRALTHGNTTSITGQFLQMTVEQLIVEIGSPNPFLLPYRDWQLLATTSWIKNLWEYTETAELSLVIPPVSLPLRRQGDQYLMPLFFQAGFRGKELLLLNQCRIWSNVISLADIVDGYGKTILPDALTGRWQASERPIRWPHQAKMPPTAWKRWERALQQTLRLANRTHLPQELHLGKWFSDGSAGDASSGWFFSPDDERLYHHDTSGCRFHPSTGPRRSTRRRRFQKTGQHCSRTPGLSWHKAVVVPQTNGDLLLLGHQECIPRPVESNDGAFAWLRVNCQQHGARRQLIDGLRSGTLKGVSDGSFKEGFGTASWKLVSDDTWVMADVVVPGKAEDQDAYRSELAGLLGLVYAVSLLAEEGNLVTFKVTLACDGASALSQCFDNEKPKPGDSQFDLIHATRNLMAKFPKASWLPRHVKGHQDNDPMAELDEWALLNIEMDEHAKLAWARHRGDGNIGAQLPESPWLVAINNDPVVRNFDQTVREHILGNRLLKWWTRKSKPSAGVFAKVDWEALSSAMKKVPQTRRIWIAKHAAGFCAVGKMMSRFNSEISPQCPRCSEPVETAQHVWACQDPGAVAQWEKSLERLDYWMRDHNTAPSIRTDILAHLRAWKQGARDGVGPSASITLPALLEQDEIGWDAFLEGRVSNQWIGIQQRYLLSIKSMASSSRWLAALITKLWDVAWDQWEHRNGIVHQGAEATALKHLQQEIDRVLSEGRRTVLENDRQFFASPNQVRKAKPDYQRAWLRSVKAAQQRRERRLMTLEPQRQIMRAWLATARTHR